MPHCFNKITALERNIRRTVHVCCQFSFIYTSFNGEMIHSFFFGVFDILYIFVAVTM